MASFLDSGNLQQIYNTNPESILFAHYAASLIDQGDLSQAIEVCEKGLAKHPHYGFGHFIISLAHYYQKNYSEAKREMEIALAYDPNLPRGWLLLGNINQSLNLPLMTKESYLKAYLVDPFNHEVAQKVFREEVQLMDVPREVTEKESEEMPVKLEEAEEVEEETVSEFIGDDIDELLGTADISEKEPGEFEKTLDEVFKETMGEVTSTELTEEPEEALEPASEKEQGEEDKKEDTSEKKEIVDDVELSSAMNSFFSEYEKEKSEIEESKVEEPSPEQKESGEISESEFPEEFIDEEPIDFSEVVADLISERDAATSGKGPEATEPEITITEEPTEPKVEEKIIPEVAPSAQAPAGESEKGPETGESTGPTEAEGETTRFGRPPILSPTLGEIYIAQGRFEEAIDVFRQLLDKDPENIRYQRKIDDLQNIIDKQKSGSPK